MIRLAVPGRSGKTLLTTAEETGIIRRPPLQALLSALKPALIVADEPVSALKTAARTQVADHCTRTCAIAARSASMTARLCGSAKKCAMLAATIGPTSGTSSSCANRLASAAARPRGRHQPW